MQALILAGGLGTRLRSVVSDRPKCMAPIENRPFLEYLIRMLHRQGCNEFILSTGYMAQTIGDYFGDGRRLGLTISYSQEAEPLGTGGALRLAEALVHDEDFLVANGDSLIEADVRRLAEFHQAKAALATIALLEVIDASRYGTVELAPDGAVTRFAEKDGRAEPGIEAKEKGERRKEKDGISPLALVPHPFLINGGVYICSRRIFESIPAGRAVSLEREVFPGLLGKGVYGMIGKPYFIDIGLPEDYARVQKHPQDLKRIAGIE